MTTYIGSVDSMKNKHIVISYRNKTVIKQYADTYNVSLKDAEEIFQETLKFLYVRSQSHYEILIPSQNIGQMWRLFVQDTKEYENFCRFYLWKYIHHKFNTNIDKDYSKAYELTIGEIRKYFSKPSNIWNNSENINQSLAFKRDITFYNVQQPVLKKKSNTNAGCVQTFAFVLIVVVIITMLTMISVYGIE